MAKECPFCHQFHFVEVKKKRSKLWEYWECANCGKKNKIKLNAHQFTGDGKNIMDNKQCGRCGSVMVYKNGIKQETGKAWQGHFCQNRECKNVEWIKTLPVNGSQAQYTPQPAPQPLKSPLPKEYGIGDFKDVAPELLLLDELQGIHTVLKEIRDNLKK